MGGRAESIDRCSTRIRSKMQNKTQRIIGVISVCLFLYWFYGDVSFEQPQPAQVLRDPPSAQRSQPDEPHSVPKRSPENTENRPDYTIIPKATGQMFNIQCPVDLSDSPFALIQDVQDTQGHTGLPGGGQIKDGIYVGMLWEAEGSGYVEIRDESRQRIRWSRSKLGIMDCQKDGPVETFSGVYGRLQPSDLRIKNTSRITVFGCSRIADVEEDGTFFIMLPPGFCTLNVQVIQDDEIAYGHETMIYVKDNIDKEVLLKLPDVSDFRPLTQAERAGLDK